MNDDSSEINNGWSKSFSPVENRSIILTISLGFLFFLLRSFYGMVHFDPFSPSFRWDSIIYLFFLQSLVPVFVFSVALHSPKEKIVKRLIILFFCVMTLVVVLGMTILSGEAGLGLMYLVLFYISAGIIAFFSGLLMRALVNFSPFISKIIVLIMLLTFPAMTAWDYYTYSKPTNLTEGKCRLLGDYAQIRCFDLLARTTNNPIYCEGASGDSGTEARCYDSVTTKLLKVGDLDLSACLKIPTNPKVIGERSACIGSIASKLDDVTKCELIEEDEIYGNRFRCINTIAQNFTKLDQKTRLEKCADLDNRGDKVSCYFVLRDSFDQYYNYARGSGNLKCDLLLNTDKDLCYYANTLGITPKKSCSMIIDGEIRRKCEAYNIGGGPRNTKEAY